MSVTVQQVEKQELANSPYRYLLDNPDFMRWCRNVKRGSVTTAHEWVRRFGRIHKTFGKLPADMAKMDVKEAARFISNIIDILEDEGKSGSYISNMIKPVKSWLNDNDIYVRKKFKIKYRNKLVRVGNEKVPTQREFGLIIAAGTLRAKALSSIIGFTSVREEVFGNSVGEDGLKVGDLPEMQIDNVARKVIFLKVPTMVIVREELSKNKHQYFSFMAEEGCRHLANSLEERMERGEILNEDSLIITQLKLISKGTHKRDKYGFLRTPNLAEDIKKAIERAGYSWRPYVLRRYFDTWMMMAEADGIIINDWRVFWMGHTGRIDAEYTVNKKLPDDIIEKMRAAYAKAAAKYLVTNNSHDQSIDKLREETNRRFLRISGFAEEQIRALGDLGSIPDEKISELILSNHKQALGLNGNSSQKIVRLSELEKYVNGGWDYVRDIPGEKVIVKLPSH